MRLKNLLDKVSEYDPKADPEKIRTAYEYAEKAYQGQTRKSGEPLLHHALGAAIKLSSLKADEQALMACLLHHVQQEKYKDVEQQFGKAIITLLEGLESLNNLKKKGKGITQAENLRKVLLASIRDMRILFIKLCEKWDNMQSLEFLEPKKQKEIAQECLEIYAPLAYRLGLGAIKSELEDLAFKYAYPQEYQEIIAQLEQTKEKRERLVEQVKKQIQKELEKADIEAEVTGRAKHLYSIYKKTITRQYDLENMFDLVGIRIITKNIEDCYRALRIVHSTYLPIQGRFKDYIASPKPNGYQSLHTAIRGPTAAPVEVQMRTEEMHKEAEEGAAVHWGYKGVTHQDKEFDKKLSWLKQSLEQESPLIDFFTDAIFVFTPKGDVIQLPRGATPLDYAYAVHSTIGNTCGGAIVNGKIVPLREELKNGDLVKIITKKDATPSRDWLRIVITQKARQKIRQAIKEKGQIPQRTLQKQQEESQEIRKQLVSIAGVEKADIIFAHCCSPLPGDEIIAHKKGIRKIMVHKEDCAQVSATDLKKEIDAVWKETFQPPVSLYIIGEDRIGFFAEVLNMVAAKQINVQGAQGKYVQNDTVQLSFDVDIDTLERLLDLIARIQKIKGVKKVMLGSLSEQ